MLDWDHNIAQELLMTDLHLYLNPRQIGAPRFTFIPRILHSADRCGRLVSRSGATADVPCSFTEGVPFLGVDYQCAFQNGNLRCR